MKSNPGIARGFGENGREYVEENLSLKRIGHEMIRLLNRILKH
jgi:glycosyltransferase involved in cell wall biosynthesis